VSVEKLIETIEAEAEAEAAATIERADGEARAIVEAARRQAAERVAAARSAAERDARSEVARSLNALRLRNVGAQAEILAGWLERVFRAAGEEAAAIADGSDPERWARALGRLVDEAVALAGPRARIAVRPGDAAAIRTAVAAVGADLEVVEDPSLPAGLVARSADGRSEVDGTLQVRLARAREQLAGEVAVRLGADAAWGRPG